MASAPARFLTAVPERLATPAGYLQQLGALLALVPCRLIEAAVERILATYRAGGNLFVCGNGGSAALASHVGCDLGKGTVAAGRPRLRVVSLTDNVPLLSALANDIGYETVFAEQLASLGRPGDAVLAISGSGNSPNILEALKQAHALGLGAIGLTGYQGGRMRALCDPCVVVPCDNMQLLEDCHVAICHAIFLAVRQAMEAAPRVVEGGVCSTA